MYTYKTMKTHKNLMNAWKEARRMWAAALTTETPEVIENAGRIMDAAEAALKAFEAAL